MADGCGPVEVIVHGRVIGAREADGMTLAQALAAGHVVSRCPSCGHRESTDTAPWASSAADRAYQLGTLRIRLRCTCGSRQVALEVWPVTPRAVEERRRMYHWRA